VFILRTLSSPLEEDGSLPLALFHPYSACKKRGFFPSMSELRKSPS
jgi:hypothetical protein